MHCQCEEDKEYLRLHNVMDSSNKSSVQVGVRSGGSREGGSRMLRICLIGVPLLLTLTVATLLLCQRVESYDRALLMARARAEIYARARPRSAAPARPSAAVVPVSVESKEDPPDKVVSCYYNTPDPYAAKQLLPTDIHPHLCTHINIAFARVVNKEIYFDKNQEQAITEIVKLKQKNPKLKILLSIGGAHDDQGFSDMVVDHASRKVFIKSIKKILRNYTLDGIDLDWEFPALHNRRDVCGKRERQHFSQLLREIRVEFGREKRDYLLTVAAAAPETIVDVSYDVDQLNLYVDYVNIMTYDFHYFTKFTPFTGLNSPLFARPTEQLYMATLNINYTVHMYMRKGLDRNKIVVGIPTYGHSFNLFNINNTNIGSPCSGFGSLGSLGFVNYPDICKFVSKFQFDVTIKQEEAAKVPYLYRYQEWASFDTPESVMEKANFIKEHNLRGAMIYALNSDDYEGVCETAPGGTVKFPLSQSVKSTLITSNTTI